MANNQYIAELEEKVVALKNNQNGEFIEMKQKIMKREIELETKLQAITEK